MSNATCRSVVPGRRWTGTLPSALSPNLDWLPLITSEPLVGAETAPVACEVPAVDHRPDPPSNLQWEQLPQSHRGESKHVVAGPGPPAIGRMADDPSARCDRSPAVSAILPVYNGAAFIRDAINSVLAQTYAPIECIVVDDGSTDDTPDLVRTYEPRVRLIQQPNQGVARARNHGAALAAGELLAFLDADDVWHPERVERQWQVLAGLPSVGAVVCATQIVDRELNPIRLVEQDPSLTVEDMLLWRWARFPRALTFSSAVRASRSSRVSTSGSRHPRTG